MASSIKKLKWPYKAALNDNMISTQPLLQIWQYKNQISIQSLLHHTETFVSYCNPRRVSQRFSAESWHFEIVNRESNKGEYLHHIQLANSVCYNKSGRIHGSICKSGWTGSNSFALFLFFFSSKRLQKGVYWKKVLTFPCFLLRSLPVS